ncbi:MAG: PLP-dependent aminotransferase family protein [Phototrophicaceae bacterium]
MELLETLFSAEAANLQRSVMRELVQLMARPGIISLAGGLPASELLPTQQLRECYNAVLEHENGDALQYRPRYHPLLEWIAGYMQSRGVPCDAEQILITNGNQQGLTLMSRLFLEPSQVAVIEAATFTGVQQTTAGRGANIRTVPVDLATGVDTRALEAAFRQAPRPHLAVLIPDFHNPLGVTLTASKRVRAAALAGQYGVPLVEDDPYSLLRFSGEMLPPVKAYDEAGFVFYLGSFSKMLAPGLRLGWIVAPPGLTTRLRVLRESIDLETSALTQRAVAEFLRRGLLEPHLERLNAANRERCAAMLVALDQHLGDIANWTEPEGGLFVWMTLPPQIDTWAMFEQALAENVAYIPGAAFAIDGGQRNSLRLNFSKVGPDDIAEGIRRLAGVIHRALE